jgi:cation diffusion facilitator family transporter
MTGEDPTVQLRIASHGASGLNDDVVRWGWYSIALNVLLIALHAMIASASNSLAVAAELVHNVVDLATAGAVLVALKLAMRKNPRFPYGLYKVENLVAAVLALMIFVTAGEILRKAFFGSPEPMVVNAWMLAVLAVTMVVPLVFSHFEMRVALAANSPALIADAREYRVHAYTTGLAFAALLSARFNLPLDRIAALLIVVVIAKTAWDLLIDACRVLIDASLDRASLDEVRRIVSADPALVAVNWVTGRNAGRFRFVEAGVTLRPEVLPKAAAAVQRIEGSVRAAVPRIERVLLHVESRIPDREIYAVPLADRDGTISEHFGEAPNFAFVTINRSSGLVEQQEIRHNPHLNEERDKGLRVAEWLTSSKVDRVLVPRSIAGKGPAYVFREAGINVQVTTARSLADMVEALPVESHAPHSC